MPSSLTLGRSASAPLGGGGPVTGGGFGSMQSRSGSGGGISAMQQFGGQSQVAMQYSGQQHSQQLYAQQRQFGGMQTTPSSSETSSGYGSGFQPPGLQSSMYTQQTQQGQAPRGSSNNGPYNRGQSWEVRHGTVGPASPVCLILIPVAAVAVGEFRMARDGRNGRSGNRCWEAVGLIWAECPCRPMEGMVR